MIETLIALKLPSLNEYTNECRRHKYAGARMKKKYEEAIGLYIQKLPRFENPVRITFIWLEGNKKRDLDNVCFAKKFILDALVKYGKLKDDNRNNVCGFTDRFLYGTTWGVVLQIVEEQNE